MHPTFIFYPFIIIINYKAVAILTLIGIKQIFIIIAIYIYFIQQMSKKMSLNNQLSDLARRFKKSDKMPLVFLGHGSPMNAIEDTQYNRVWKELGEKLPHPQAILVISAHWMTKGETLVDISKFPRTIHDFYGFPEALYQEDYPANGSPKLAQEVISLLKSHNVKGDDRWGLDHGAWAVLKFLYPKANIPVFQLSIDMNQSLTYQMEIGKALSELRGQGVLILGSGNIVHNLSAMRGDGNVHDFAENFDRFFEEKLQSGDYTALADRKEMGSMFEMSHPSFDHYLPALTVLGASERKDEVTTMTGTIEFGSVSMRSFVLS